MVKKILIVLGLLIIVLLPITTFAQFPTAEMSDCCQSKHQIDSYPVGSVFGPSTGSCSSKGQTLTVSVPTPDWGGYCTMDSVLTITDFVFWLFFAFSVIMGAWAGFTFLTAGGNPAQMQKAKDMLVYIVVGIIVAVAVRLIPSLARTIIGI